LLTGERYQDASRARRGGEREGRSRRGYVRGAMKPKEESVERWEEASRLMMKDEGG
jgi:hypothetical protein